MPKITIEIEFMGAPDVEMQRPVGEILKAHSTELLSHGMKPQGEKEYQIENDYYVYPIKAVLKWKVERGEK